jgi:hypothetical protein
MIEKIKELRYWIVTVVILIMATILFLVIYRILKKKNKTITIYPSLRIKDIINTNEIDNNELSGIVRLGQEAINRIKKHKKS